MLNIKNKSVYIFFFLILLLGIFARIWEFGSLPPGLNQDEASSGVDAFSLLHYGVDRNGESFPVQFISWGSGQNALYAWLMIPFIAIGGLTPITVRLPMLFSGILTLPLIFYVARRIEDDLFGLLAMLFIAISPWHIILSRWGLESNILPFWFLAAFVCLLKSELDNRWFIIACLLFGLSLYAYAPAYVAVPVFMACASPIMIFSKRVKLSNLLAGWFVLVAVSIPIGLFVLINSFKLQTIQLGMMTIPRLPTETRLEMMGAMFKPNFLHVIKSNLLNTFNILWTQTDHQPWNVLPAYGYFYRYTLPLAAIGVLGLLPLRKTWFKPEKLLLLAWLVAAILLGILQDAIFNRINLIFIPLIICMAYPFTWFKGRFISLRWLSVAVLLVGFAAFTRDYHSEAYRQEAGSAYSNGLLPAMDAARRAGRGPICVTNAEVNMPYIYALFVEQINPADYLSSVQYIDLADPFRKVRSFGRYTFGLENCPRTPETIYVLKTETPPQNNNSYQLEQFDFFQVYKP